MRLETIISLSREQIRDIARYVRNEYKIKEIKFNVLSLLSDLKRQYKDIFSCSVKKNIKDNAYLDIKDNSYHMYVDENTYSQAKENDKQAIGYVLFPICQFILVNVLGITYKKIPSVEIPTYKDGNWQIKALSGELLIPFDECKNMDKQELLDNTNALSSQIDYFLEYVIKP